MFQGGTYAFFCLGFQLLIYINPVLQLSPPFMMVRLYARLLSFGQDVKQSTVGSFLDSAIYKEHITRRLQCGLLDPNILYYVQGTTSRFVVSEVCF